LKKVVITQSNYIPWKGFFDAIRTADEFVLYDDMQYTRRDWRNRNKIKTPQGLQWLTIPVLVKGKFSQKINETLVSESQWSQQHWKSIQLNYKKAPCFDEMHDFFDLLYREVPSNNLSEINHWFLTQISKWMGINTTFTFSSQYTLEGERTDRLVNLCKQLKATDYYTGPAAKEYMNEDKFNDEGVKVHYFDYSGYPEYNQLFPPFEHAVSIVDLLMHTGRDFAKFMK
jgi:hypothetical protein